MKCDVIAAGIVAAAKQVNQLKLEEQLYHCQIFEILFVLLEPSQARILCGSCSEMNEVKFAGEIESSTSCASGGYKCGCWEDHSKGTVMPVFSS